MGMSSAVLWRRINVGRYGSFSVPYLLILTIEDSNINVIMFFKSVNHTSVYINVTQSSQDRLMRIINKYID